MPAKIKRLFTFALSASLLDTVTGGVFNTLSVHWITVESEIELNELEVGQAVGKEVNRLWMSLYPLDSGWRLHQFKVTEIPGEEVIGISPTQKGAAHEPEHTG